MKNSFREPESTTERQSWSAILYNVHNNMEMRLGRMAECPARVELFSRPHPTRFGEDSAASDPAETSFVSSSGLLCVSNDEINIDSKIKHDGAQ